MTMEWLQGFSESWAWAALAAALASHVMVGLALAETLAALGHRLPGPSVLGIALVSTTANYLVSSGGVSGFALKAHLLHKRRVPIATTVTASAVSSAMMYAVLAVILGQGLLALALSEGGRPDMGQTALALGGALLAAAALSTVFFNHRVRSRVVRWLFHWSNLAAYKLSKKEIPREDFHAFERQLTHGLAQIRAGHGRLTRAVVYTCLDWGLAMASLWFCFRAAGVSLPIGGLSAAFTVGQAATLVPLLPGGIGAAEGSIVAVMSGLGVAAGPALLAAVLYRLCYYIVPSVLSVLVLWGLKVSEPAVLHDAAELDVEIKRKS